MSGPLGSSQWMYASGGFYPYNIGQSLRFNDNDSAYLSWTPASAGNRKTWTWSGWVKRANLGSAQTLLGANTTFVEFTSADKIQFDHNGTTVATSAVFRDPSAWYHVVVAVDTTQATAADRTEIYVNGTIQAVTGSYVSQNTDTDVNAATQHNIGANLTPAEYLDGYMAEVNFIDGLALDPTSFGEFKSGIWVPKKYTGSYGTNGFYLNFSDSAAIGDDLSGNGNDWTPSGLASTDVLLDSPTNNYAVLNQLSAGAAAKAVLSNGNLDFGITASAGRDCWATITPSSGKWYWEVTAGSNSSSPTLTIGVSLQPTDAKRARYLGDGTVSTSGLSGTSGTGSFASYTTADVIGVAFDVDARSVAFYKNNVLQTTVSWSDLDQLTPYVSGSNFASSSNFGQSPFAYTPPAGFLALNTANLPEPTISPALDDVPADYFNTVLYTGNGLTQSITGVGFQPDWTWIKGRSGATDHALYDAVRGVQEQLESNQTGAETTEATGLTAVGADGFSVGALAQLNTITATYVAWNWKANGAGVANTDGTITSTVSANQKAGFSIVSYTGTGANATVGHGLGAAPDVLIIKARNDTRDWSVYHAANTAAPETDYLRLSTTDATADDATVWNDTAPTSSVFSLGSAFLTNRSTYNYIAYCFAEVEGYSKFGSYTGNGSADGPMIYLGFRPAFVMVKRTDTTGNWTILDDVREGYNVDNDPLYPNLSNAEGTTDLADLLSNGFKLRSTDASVNASGGTYIFAAFAEQPFKYSNAR